jgi:hypothetical protein
MESRIETSELQQLVGSDVDGENDDSTAQDDNINEIKVVSPVRSNKVLILIETDKKFQAHVSVYYRCLHLETPVTVLLRNWVTVIIWV